MKHPKLLLVAALVAAPVAFGATAKENWDQHCAKCHAADGSGNTVVGKKLKLKDYTTADGQKFSDEEGHKAIKEGVKNAAGKEVMKGFADKVSDAEINDLVALIRTFKK